MSMEAVMSIRLASNSIRIRRQGFMGFKLSCSFAALAVLGVTLVGSSWAYAGVAYAHFSQEEGQKVTAVQNTPADLPTLDLAADPVWLSPSGNDAGLSQALTAKDGNESSGQWLAKWDASSTEPSSVSGNLRSTKPASSQEDADSMQVRPLAIPTPSAWSAGMAGLIGLGLARIVYRVRAVRRNYR